MSAVLVSKHELHFSNRNSIPIAEIAQSLLALDKTIRVSCGAFNALIFDDAVERMEVELSRLEAGSLSDNFILRFFFKDEAQLNRFIEQWRDRLHIGELMEKHPVIGTVLMLTLSYGLVLAAQKFGSQEKPVHIENSFNNAVVAAGDVLNLDPETIRKKLSDGVTAKDWLANRAAKLVHPAKLDARAEVRMDNYEPIPPEALLEVPSMTSEGAEETVEILTNVEIRVRALDLDNRKKGWWAIMESVGDRRIRLQLDPSVNPHDLLRSDVVRVNAELISTLDEDGEKTERLIFVRQVLPVENLSPED